MGAGGVREQRADDTEDGTNDSRSGRWQTPTHMEPARCFGGRSECPLLLPLGSAGSAALSPVADRVLVKHALYVAFVPNDH